MSFSEFQDLALYHPQAGFYANRGSAGRVGDFITSPEVGPLFGHVISLALDKWWKQLGRPDPFFVIEVGAGSGSLASSVLDATPACAHALRYVAVERSAGLRAEQAGRYLLDTPENVLKLTSAVPVVGSKGPLVTSLAEIPDGKFTGVILANELLDNLPVDVFERRGRHWYKLCVALSKDGGFSEMLVEASEIEGGPEIAAQLDHLAPAAADGSRVPYQMIGREWLSNALSHIERGKIVCFDYAHTTRWMSRHGWEDWLRTYRNHRPGGHPLESPGTKDITCDVAIDQLSLVRRPDRDRTQADFLEANGLVELIAEARDAWHGNASLGDLGAAKARSRVNEGRALTDPNGLGRYRAFEWDVS
jgi:SAM-dependent MidA family methyltransferase